VKNVQQLVQAISQTKAVAVETPLTVSESDQADTGDAAGIFASLLSALQARIDPVNIDAGPAPPSVPPEGTTPTQVGGVPATSKAIGDAALVTSVAMPIPEEGDASPVAIPASASEEEGGAAPLPLKPVTVMEGEKTLQPIRIATQAAVVPEVAPGDSKAKRPAARPTMGVVSMEGPSEGGKDRPAAVAAAQPRPSPSVSIADAAAALRDLLAPKVSSQDDGVLNPERLQVANLEPGAQSGFGAGLKGNLSQPVTASDARPVSSVVSTADPLPLRSVPEFSIRSIKYLMENNVESIRVRLVPRSLGELQISVVKTDDVSKVVISSANPAVRDFLDSQLSGLRENLHKEAIQVNQITVQARPVSVGDPTSQGNGQQHASSSGGETRPQPEAKSPTAMSGGRTRAMPRHHDGVLNMYV
jgi:Flagellar hook-length control protein FliK